MLKFGIAFLALCSVAQAACITPQGEAPDVLICGVPAVMSGFADGCADTGKCTMPKGEDIGHSDIASGVLAACLASNTSAAKCAQRFYREKATLAGYAAANAASRYKAAKAKATIERLAKGKH
jgi:hypothetical protein